MTHNYKEAYDWFDQFSKHWGNVGGKKSLRVRDATLSALQSAMDFEITLQKYDVTLNPADTSQNSDFCEAVQNDDFYVPEYKEQFTGEK